MGEYGKRIQGGEEIEEKRLDDCMVRFGRVLACDPSLRAWGYAVLNGDIIEDCGCIQTVPLVKKNKVTVADDRIRRIREINNQLKSIFLEHDIRTIVCEQPHGSQTATGAIMIGITMGIMQTISDMTFIPIEWYSEKKAKKACGFETKKVSKEDMVIRIKELYGYEWASGVKYWDSAVADSLAVYQAYKNSFPKTLDS